MPHTRRNPHRIDRRSARSAEPGYDRGHATARRRSASAHRVEGRLGRKPEPPSVQSGRPGKDGASFPPYVSLVLLVAMIALIILVAFAFDR